MLLAIGILVIVVLSVGQYYNQKMNNKPAIYILNSMYWLTVASFTKALSDSENWIIIIWLILAICDLYRFIEWVKNHADM